MGDDTAIRNYKLIGALVAVLGWSLVGWGMHLVLGWGGSLIVLGLPMFVWGVRTSFLMSRIDRRDY